MGKTKLSKEFEEFEKAKSETLKDGLELLNYIEWCKTFDTQQLSKIPDYFTNKYGFGEVTKKELFNYYDKENKTHHAQMNNKTRTDLYQDLLKCYSCEHQKGISKSTRFGEKQTYIITCKKECICFQADWNEHKSNLPCWRDEK